MTVIVHERNGVKIASVQADEILIPDPSYALDMIMQVRVDSECYRLVLPKQVIPEEFFELKTGFAGEMLQKFINYNAKLAIVGDFSRYDSKALRDFIRESNRGKDIFFLETEEEALEKLASV